MSSLYHFIWVGIHFLACASVAATRGLHAVKDGLRQRHAAVFGKRMNAKATFFSEIGATSNRFLQDIGGSEEESQCNSTIQRDDPFTVNAYGANSSATCDCTSRNNVNEVILPLYSALPNNQTATQDEIDAYVMEFNTAVGGIQLNTTASCTTECSVCFADTEITPSAFCGVMSYSEISHLRGVSGNITWDDIRTGSINSLNASTDEELLSFVSATGVSCVEFTTVSSGTLCVGIGLDVNDTFTCSIEYNGITCNSCENVETATDSCLIADCTNVSPSTMLDSCNMTGFVGPFAFLPLIGSVDDSVNYTLGNCNVSSAPPPTAPVSSNGTMAPTTPLAEPILSDAPSLVPSDMPSMAPVAMNDTGTEETMGPTGMPVTTTTAPSTNDTTPTAPAPVATTPAPLAPVAPVASVPVPQAPSAPTAAGSSSSTVSWRLGVSTMVVMVVVGVVFA